MALCAEHIGDERDSCLLAVTSTVRSQRFRINERTTTRTSASLLQSLIVIFECNTMRKTVLLPFVDSKSLRSNGNCLVSHHIIDVTYLSPHNCHVHLSSRCLVTPFRQPHDRIGRNCFSMTQFALQFFQGDYTAMIFE